MSLFKSQILNCYNLMQYQDDFLLLHCSRNDMIHAPFDGKVEATEDGCILYNNDFKLYITHIDCDINQEVSAGQIIGVPKMGRVLGEKKAYIGVKIYYKDELHDVTTYLYGIDKTIYEEKEEVQEVVKPKRKSNKKKK